MPEPTIIYEDADILVLNKPAGLSVHPNAFSPREAQEPTLVDWLLGKYPELIEVGEPIKLPSGGEIKRPGIVHRLDKDTSGVLVVAKSQSAFQFLKQQFAERRLEKKYWALVYGEMKSDHGVIDWPIGRSRNDARRRIALPPTKQGAKNVSGPFRAAVTEWRALEHLPNSAKASLGGPGFTLLEVRPRTGRTHQIRVHLKALGYPIVGDPLYAPQSLLSQRLPRGGALRGQFLHAASLTLELPSGETKEFTATLPDDLTQIIDTLRVGS